MDAIILLGLSLIIYFSLKDIIKRSKCKKCSYCCNDAKLKTPIFKLKKK